MSQSREEQTDRTRRKARARDTYMMGFAPDRNAWTCCEADAHRALNVSVDEREALYSAEPDDAS